MMKVILLSFCNKSWHKKHPPLKRLRKEALRMGMFDEILLYDEDDFDVDYREKYAERFKERGFGYWQWKSYLIKRELKRLDDGDILFYCDSGCHLNSNGRKRFIEYLDMVKQSESGILAIDNGLDERRWTKGDLFEFFGLNMETYQGTQYVGTVFFLRKSLIVESFVQDLFDITHHHHSLITDEPSTNSNHSSFVENRHDQSALSLLLHTKYQAITISENEVWPCWNHDWSLLWDKPIWACRDEVEEAERIAFKMKLKHTLKSLYTRVKLS